MKKPRIITYTNRKGKTYYLCQGSTKTGKPRYFFAREPKGAPVEKIPKGFAISESVNGIVSLTRVRPMLLLQQEVDVVETALRKHPQAKRFRVSIKSKQITIYELVGPDMQDLVRTLATKLGMTSLLKSDVAQCLQTEEDAYSQFMPVMRFTLKDTQKRLFGAQRMCHSSRIDDWIDIGFNKSIEEIASTAIPALGTEKFYELHWSSRAWAAK